MKGLNEFELEIKKPPDGNQAALTVTDITMVNLSTVDPITQPIFELEINSESIQEAKHTIDSKKTNVNLYYALCGDPLPWLSRKTVGPLAIFDYEFGFWVFETKEEAEEVLKNHPKQCAKLVVRSRPSNIAHTYLHGTSQQKKAAKCRLKIEIERREFEQDEEKFYIDCERAGIDKTVLSDDLETFPENHREGFKRFKIRHEQLESRKRKLDQDEEECKKKEAAADQQKIKDDKNAIEARHGNYVIKKSGLFYSPLKKTNGKESEEACEEDIEEIRICSPIWPEAYLRDKEGKSHTLLLRVHDGEKDHKIAIPRRMITKWAELSEILLDLGQSVPTSPAIQKHLQNFLMQARPQKLMRCVDKCGWHDGQYLFPNGEIIGEAKDGDESIYPIHEAYSKGIGSKGTLLEWQANVVSLCVNNSRLIFGLGTGFASVCLEIVGAESGGFNLRGPSSKGKSKCLRVAISVFGSPEYERTWKATANGLEGICVLYNDGLLALDEMGQSEPKEIGQIAYSICSGIEKTRSNRSITTREARNWRVLLLSTAEISLEEHMKEGNKQAKAGQLVRIIDVPAICHQQYGCFEDIHGFRDSKSFADAVAERCKQFYGTAIRRFIQEVILQGLDKAKKELIHAKDDFVADNAANCDGQVLRVADRFGVVYGALLLASKYGILNNPNASGVLVKSITPDMIKDAISSCFKDWLATRGTTGDMESYKLVDRVVGLLNENSDGKFANYYDTTAQPIRHTLWGYKNGTLYYVFPKAFRDLCGGMEQIDAAVILKEKKILQPDKKKNSKSVTIPAHGKKTRYYVLDITSDEDDEDVIC